ncbi:MAG: hypothetical protein HRU38_23395 [Saccharospirillaceae bacterium]|nr:hypothetical protein [Saccharospirillaceae bacterium]
MGWISITIITENTFKNKGLQNDKKTILLASVLAISACSANKDIMATNESEVLEDKAATVRLVCLSCGEVALLLTKVESKQCGTPYNTATFDRFIQSEPIFAVALAVSSGTGLSIEQISEPLEKSIECDNPDGWVDGFKEQIKSKEFQRKLAVLTNNAT